MEYKSKRDRRIGVSFTADEEMRVVRRAIAAGLNAPQWARQQVLRALRRMERRESQR